MHRYQKHQSQGREPLPPPISLPSTTAEVVRSIVQEVRKHQAFVPPVVLKELQDTMQPLHGALATLQKLTALAPYGAHLMLDTLCQNQQVLAQQSAGHGEPHQCHQSGETARRDCTNDLTNRCPTSAEPRSDSDCRREGGPGNYQWRSGGPGPQPGRKVPDEQRS